MNYRRFGLLLFVFGGALLLSPASGSAAQSVTTRVSVDSSGAEGNGRSLYPSISADGRYVAFDSYANNLVAGDSNGKLDVFVRDRQTGATTRVSVDSSGGEGNEDSSHPSISADGRYVAFDSKAGSLVAGDSNGKIDVFVHDRQTGTTTRVSIDSSGVQRDGGSSSPSISADGRYVAFDSGDGSPPTDFPCYNQVDVFVHDRQTGATTRVSVDSSGAEVNGLSSVPSISGDGRYVAFSSTASNLVSGDSNGASDVFVHDRQTGTTTIVSVNSSGSVGNGHSLVSSISADGRYVAFVSEASNLVSFFDSKSFLPIFIHDRQTGTTTGLSVDASGIGGQGGFSSYPSISTNAAIKRPLLGTCAMGPSYPSISADGRYVAFISSVSNLVSGDLNDMNDIFIYDRQTGVTTRVSVDSRGAEGNGNSYAPSISGDGRYVVFSSAADNLVAGDTNGTVDVFVRDRDLLKDFPWPMFLPAITHKVKL